MSWMFSARLRAVTTTSSGWASATALAGGAEGVGLCWARAAGLAKPNAAPTKNVTAPPRSQSPWSAPTAAIRLRTSRILPPHLVFRTSSTDLDRVGAYLGGNQCNRLHRVDKKTESTPGHPASPTGF